jgi:hypothetical protein
VFKELAYGVTADIIEPILDNPAPEITTLFKEEPVFSSDVHCDASGVLLADMPAGKYVLMCRTTDVGQGLYLAARPPRTRRPSSPSLGFPT